MGVVDIAQNKRKRASLASSAALGSLFLPLYKQKRASVAFSAVWEA